VQTNGLVGDKTYKRQQPASVTKDLLSEKISRTSKGFHPVFYVIKTYKHKISIV
jgi:hypothetical protein